MIKLDYAIYEKAFTIFCIIVCNILWYITYLRKVWKVIMLNSNRVTLVMFVKTSYHASSSIFLSIWNTESNPLELFAYQISNISKQLNPFHVPFFEVVIYLIHLWSLSRVVLTAFSERYRSHDEGSVSEAQVKFTRRHLFIRWYPG